MAAVREAGEEGMLLADVAQNTRRIESLSLTAEWRVPDILDRVHKVIGEVKNVKKLALTQQIRDDVLFAEKYGWKMELHVRRGAQLTGPLWELINSNKIKLIWFP